MKRPTLLVFTLAEGADSEGGRLSIGRVVEGFTTSVVPCPVPPALLVGRFGWIDGEPTAVIRGRIVTIGPDGSELGETPLEFDPPKRLPDHATVGVQFTGPVSPPGNPMVVPLPGLYRFRLEIEGETLGETFLEARLLPPASGGIQH